MFILSVVHYRCLINFDNNVSSEKSSNQNICNSRHNIYWSVPSLQENILHVKLNRQHGYFIHQNLWPFENLINFVCRFCYCRWFQITMITIQTILSSCTTTIVFSCTTRQTFVLYLSISRLQPNITSMSSGSPFLACMDRVAELRLQAAAAGERRFIEPTSSAHATKKNTSLIIWTEINGISSYLLHL